MMRKMRWTKIIAGLAATFAILGACGGGDGPSPGPAVEAPIPAAAESAEEPQKPGGPPEADLAPDFTVTTFEGERFRLSEFRGTPVVLNFWESW